VDLDSLLPQPWMARGSCTSHPDPDLWHTDKLDDLPTAVVADRTREAKGICAGCTVRADCEAFGRLPGPSLEYGIYGGTTPNQRGRAEYLADQAAERLASMRYLRSKGMTYEDIGAALGIAKQSVHEALARTA
jgi:hypothetical protein